MTSPRRSARRRLGIALLLGAATLGGSLALARFATHRDALRIVLGLAYWPVSIGLVASVASALVALGRSLTGRPHTWSFAGALRIGFCVFVLGWAVVLVALQPYRGLYVEFVLGACCGVFALAYLAQARLERALPPRMRSAAHLLVFNVCLLPVLGEVGLRLVARWSPSPLLARVDSAADDLLAAQRHAPGEVRWGFPCNALGHYDGAFEPRAKRTRPMVAVIGDSFSAGTVPHFFHFTTVCERELDGVELYNFGVPGIGPREYLHLLRHEVLPLEPDAIIVDLFVGNDIGQSRRDLRAESWLREVFDRDRLLLAVFPTRLAIRSALSRDARPQDESDGAVLPQDAATLIDAFPWVADPQREAATLPREQFLAILTRQAHYHASPLGDPGLRALYEVLTEMRTAAGSIPFAVMLIPEESQIEEQLWRQITTPAAGLDRTRAQREIGQWAAAAGIPCLDLIPVLTAQPIGDDGSRHCYHTHDTHWNARGNAAVGRALAPFVKAMLAE